MDSGHAAAAPWGGRCGGTLGEHRVGGLRSLRLVGAVRQVLRALLEQRAGGARGEQPELREVRGRGVEAHERVEEAPLAVLVPSRRGGGDGKVVEVGVEHPVLGDPPPEHAHLACAVHEQEARALGRRGYEAGRALVGHEPLAHRAERRKDARGERHAVGHARPRLEAAERPVVHEPDLAAALRLPHAPVVLAHGEGVAASRLHPAVGGNAEVQRHGDAPRVARLRQRAQRALERLPLHASLPPSDAPAGGVALPALPQGLEGRHGDPLGLVDDHAHSAGLPSSVISSRSSR